MDEMVTPNKILKKVLPNDYLRQNLNLANFKHIKLDADILKFIPKGSSVYIPFQDNKGLQTKQRQNGVDYKILDDCNISLIFDKKNYGVILQIGQGENLESMAKCLLSMLDDIDNGCNKQVDEKLPNRQKVNLKLKKGHVFVVVGSMNCGASILE